MRPGSSPTGAGAGRTKDRHISRGLRPSPGSTRTWSTRWPRSATSRLWDTPYRMVSQAIVVAFGVDAECRRKVLGFDIGDSKNEVFWTAFLRSLKSRRLGRIRPEISVEQTYTLKACHLTGARRL